MASNADTVSAFIESWSKLDSAELAAWFTEDGCYHNIPFQPVRGRQAVEAFIAEFIKTWTHTEWEIRNLVESGNVVMCERLDKTKSTAGDVDLPCVGVFEMEGGKIKEWRDYFDHSTYMLAMSG